MELPTYSGKDARLALTRRWGLPNTAPRAVESHFCSCRLMFVDDDRDGMPICYWIPERIYASKNWLTKA